MIKITGIEWKSYMADVIAWPKGAWFDDEEIKINGRLPGNEFDVENVDDAAKVELSYGVYYKNDYDFEGRSLEAHFKAWRKNQTTAFGSVEAPKENAAAVKAAILAAGGKVTGL